MNIHEYQAKVLLASYGAPVARGMLATTPAEAEAAAAELGVTVAVKAQIHAGGRGKGRFREPQAGSGGGVRLARSPPEAAVHARQMIGRTLVTHQTGPAGRKVGKVYVEEASAIGRELYLSLVIDRNRGRVAFVASAAGGMDIEEVARTTPERVDTIAIDPATGLMPHHGRRLARALGLSGDPARAAAALAATLLRAFTETDMSLLEINPLVVTEAGGLLCLDAKIVFDDNGLFRHPEIAALRDETEEDPREVEASRHGLAYIALEGTIGCMVNGAGLAMATMDIIKLHGAAPANFLDVGGGASREKVAAAFKVITADPQVKGILVNIFGGIMRCDIIAEGIVAAVKDAGLAVPLVVRLEGTNVELGREILARSGLAVIPANDLEDAAVKIIAAVKG
ncbi:MAG: ADP-forming succinate--CoA ligase subunit beta [Bauldia sp.]|nr:ADP-forming succinate--CoA ligase subunit beta [Bauldia sp.]